MFPPETMHTILPPRPGRRARPRARARRRPRRPRARARRAAGRRRRSRRARPTYAPSSASLHARPHRRQHRRRAGAVDERGPYSTVVGSPALESRGQRRARLGLDRVDLAAGRSALTALAIPTTEAAAAEGDEHRVEIRAGPRGSPGRSCRCRPSRARPGPGGRTALDALERATPTIACHQRSYGTFTTCPPSRSIASSFVCGAWSGTTIVAGQPELAGRPGHALGHVPGAGGDDPARSCSAVGGGSRWSRRGS